MEPAIRDAVVAYLQDWLSEEAKREYREMIRTDPERWSSHPHFEGGVIVRHALRGNGLTEEVLGVKSLDDLWPDLLRRAVGEV